MVSESDSSLNKGFSLPKKALRLLDLFLCRAFNSLDEFASNELIPRSESVVLNLLDGLLKS